MTYPRPECLMTTERLAALLDGGAAVTVLDGSYKMPGVAPTAGEDFQACHIAGARFFDIEAVCDRAASLPHMLPCEDEFSLAAAGLGISPDTLVVVYDAAGLMSAGRVWWTFRAFGHDRIAVLDGGLRKWLAEGRPVASGPEAAPANPGTFRARLRPGLVRGLAQMRDNLALRREQVIDARSSARFHGTEPEKWPGRRPGHIPGSLNLPFEHLTDPATGTMLPRPQLERLFAGAGLTGEKPVVATCGSGVTACALAFALHLLGREDVSVYDGAWAEWGLRDDVPVARAVPGKV